MPTFVADEVVTATKLNAATARDWTDWSPTYANLTIGSGTVTARFLEGLGGLVVAKFKFTFGSGSAVGTGPTISLPVTASADQVDMTSACSLRDVGGLRYNAVARIATTTTVEPMRASGTEHRVDGISATLPFTWATGDIISFTIIYEAA